MKQCPRCKTYLFEDMGICYKCLCEFEDANGTEGGARRKDSTAVRDSCALDLGEWVVLATAHLTRGLTAPSPSPELFMAFPLEAGESGEDEEPVLRLSLEMRRREGGAMTCEPRPSGEPALSYPTISS